MSYCLQHIEGGETNVNVTQPRSNYGGQGYKRNFEGALTLRKGFFKTTWGNQDQADGQGKGGKREDVIATHTTIEGNEYPVFFNRSMWPSSANAGELKKG
jgi:hypothetical protein